MFGDGLRELQRPREGLCHSEGARRERREQPVEEIGKRLAGGSVLPARRSPLGLQADPSGAIRSKQAAADLQGLGKRDLRSPDLIQGVEGLLELLQPPEPTFQPLQALQEFPMKPVMRRIWKRGLHGENLRDRDG
jgi:hypothetical protein